LGLFGPARLCLDNALIPVGIFMRLITLVVYMSVFHYVALQVHIAVHDTKNFNELLIKANAE
jgi:hypothetical protein